MDYPRNTKKYKRKNITEYYNIYRNFTPWVYVQSINLSNSASDVWGFIESIHFVDLLC